MYDAGSQPYCAFDNIDTNYWHSNGEYSSWLKIEFPKVMIINKIIASTQNGPSDNDYHPNSWNVQYSNDNNHWNNVMSFISSNKPNTSVVVEFDDIATKYLRFYSNDICNQSHNEYYREFGNIKIFGPDEDKLIKTTNNYIGGWCIL